MIEVGIYEEDGRMIATSIQFLKSDLYTQHMCSIGNADEILPKLVQHKAYRQKLCALHQASESVLQILKFIRNGRTPRWSVASTLADYNGDKKRSSTETLYQNLGYN